ncbi:hypothetical protein RFI_24549 [Reticulomyxa filosa]|uniref:Uncharacterized protein n=1 Tax=Reticulomyxa filosa TaxID=46433 RepID=X6MG06_RETFI|nr:hypothetical protein RFI_24549 [Reticulomyxa filosa]|eukprot:ETO12824.1 hypothetical protein RFI_24549 [Reticulomyxa filosa]
MLDFQEECISRPTKNLFGVWYFFLVLLLFLESGILIYLFRQFWCRRDSPQTVLRVPLLSFHLVLLVYCVIIISLYSPMLSQGTNGKDRSYASCLVEHFGVFIVMLLYVLILLFWLLRLNIVFNTQETQQLSTPCNRVIRVSVAIGIGLMLWWLIRFVIKRDFCLYGIEVLDFIPFTNHHQIISNVIACGLTIFFNIALSYTYIKKFSSLVTSMEPDAIAQHVNFRTHRHLRHVTTIAVISGVSSLLGLGLWSFLFVGIFFVTIDAFINGLLMIASFQFGKWICCCLDPSESNGSIELQQNL